MEVAGGTPAFSLVLHTWTQDLAARIHLHAVMACGVLGKHAGGTRPGAGVSEPLHAPHGHQQLKLIQGVRNDEVVFPVRANDHGGKRTVRLDGTQFVHRFLLHVLPTGIKRIRHYRVLASACKGVKLPAAQLALQMPALNPPAIEPAKAFMARVARMDVGLCPCCKVGRLRVVAALAGLGRLPGPACTVAPHSRGPP